MSANKYSFMKSIFNGHVNEAMLHHFPYFDSPREDDFNLVSKTVADWLQENVDPRKLDECKGMPAEVLQGLRELGLFGLIIPEAFGGGEFNQTLYVRTLELLSSHESSVALTVGAHQSIGMKGLLLFGTDAQKQKYFPKLASGEMIASFALTEPSAGSDAANIQCRAVRQGDHYVINGTKLWITNGGFADFFTVFAKETINGEERITAFIVTRDMGGVSHGAEEEKLGMHASSTVEVHFKDVKVPLENVLSQPGDGFKVAMAILNQGRLGLAGSAVGTIKVLLEQSANYAKSRKAFGSEIAKFELVQNMLTEMTCYLYAIESMTYFATRLVDDRDFDYSIEAAICKIYGTEVGWKAINLAVQLHGGNGYMKDYGLEKRLRDSRIGSIFEGTNEILRLFVALTGLKELASEYKRVGKELQNIKNFDSLESAISKFGVISEFAFHQLKHQVMTEQLKGFHPALEKEAERLAASTKILTSTAGKLIRQYGEKLPEAQLQLARLADIAINTYMIACCLARANSAIEKRGGLEKNKDEVALAQLVIRNAKAEINQLSFDINKNRDSDVKKIANFVCSNGYPFHLRREGR